MRAVVFHGPGQKHWEEVPDPKIVDDSDAIVRITSTTICGTDLHILKGDVPAMTPGRILGHEAVDTVTEIGPGVRSVKRAAVVHFGVRPMPFLPGAQVRALH
jgi:alcohol dehydrogenase